MIYTGYIKKKVQKLRKLGKTYTDINRILKISIPKSTISGWCHNISLPPDYQDKIAKLNASNLIHAQKIAWKVNKTHRNRYLDTIKEKNIPIAKNIQETSTGLIALAMLCLGEASKSKTKHKSFSLGSSDPRIIIIFLALLKRFEEFKKEKLRCTVQCRADQDIKKLEKYWYGVTKISKKYFYPARIDPRTVNKPTQNKDYMGVLVIDYYDRKIQLILESLADIVYNQLKI
ncbi:MAG: hypothetical protein NTY75_04530 [Candidatus Shapirobacteria bacterium]|nr:hypothetical protein [Candidatus Shapirobacteria bacterium]